MNQVVQDINRGIKQYPLLKLIESNRGIIVVGDITLTHPDIGEYDKYSVSINFSKTYPKCFPKVTEVSKKIPRNARRHVNTDNTLCLAVEPEEKLICRNGITFKFFLDKVLVPHLSRETYRNLHGDYEDGEYSHGLDGLWEFFGQKLNVTDKKCVIKEFEIMLQGHWQKRNEFCYCGSQIKFKKCHLKKWNELMVLGKDYLRTRLELLKFDLTQQ